ncbi:MAG: carboxylating nicotinate-nucleotide diphosphorylase [Bacteroidales bacterium]
MNTDDIVIQAIAEDHGSGDHTSLATIPSTAQGSARLIAKENGIISGTAIGCKVFQKIDPSLHIQVITPDGRHVNSGDEILKVKGSARSIVMAERLALNFLQRMSGIATSTGQYVEAVKEFPAKILDTRKTTPLLRQLEKKAVKDGGGGNHRMGLYDMIMIKDNHIDFAGGIAPAIETAVEYLKNNNLTLPVEIEVRDFEELRQVIASGKITRIMLDNFSPEDLVIAVQSINGKYETEASGGITLENIKNYAASGVDYISVGALTHRIKSMDMSLKAEF